jgi:hypothetical protein
MHKSRNLVKGTCKLSKENKEKGNYRASKNVVPKLKVTQGCNEPFTKAPMEMRPYETLAC